MPTPLAIFVYNRPAHTTRLLTSLLQCRRIEECSIHIYCDGQNPTSPAAPIEATRRIVREWADFNRAHVAVQQVNRGPDIAISEAVSDLCSRFGRVIVVEDDLELSPDFIDYMLQALDIYQDAENVYQISGFMFPVKNRPRPDAFFLNLTTSWGWSTWARAWKSFTWEATPYLDMVKDSATRRRYNFGASYPYAEMLEQQVQEGALTWDIMWWSAVFRANALVLHPRVSLVRNGGFDGSGAHYVPGIASPFVQPPSKLELPDCFECDAHAEKMVRAFLRPSLRGRLVGGFRRRAGNTLQRCSKDTFT